MTCSFNSTPAMRVFTNSARSAWFAREALKMSFGPSNTLARMNSRFTPAEPGPDWLANRWAAA
jgi:hypothetical protein